MFEGSLVYKTDDHIYKYTVYGTDNSQQMSLIVTSGSENALEFMDQSKSEEIGISKWTKSERRVDIGLANVKTEVNKHLDVEKNKRVKDTVNNNFFCHMAAIIRFAKNNCTKYNEKNNLAGLALADGTFEVVPKVDYEIAYPTEKDRIFAKVTLEYGDVVAMHIESPILDVDFKPSYETPKLFTSIKDGWRRGIGFDADYLGFALPEQKLVEIQDTSGMYSNIEEIIAAHPDKNFSWLLGKDYRIVTDENLDEVCNYIMNWDGKVFYDTETTGLNINFMSREGKADQMVGIVLSVKFGESFYFPCQMKSIKNLCGGDHRYFMERYMKPILETKQLVAHNMAFDWKVAYIYNINANIVDDTMAILLLTLSADHKNYPVGLKENAKRLLGRDSLELSDLVKNNEWGENSDIKFWDLPYELVRLYACADTDNTNGLLGYAEETQLLDKYNARKIYDIEIAFSYAVAYQEFYGHRMNLQNIANVRAEIQTNQDRNYNLMKEIAGHDFNPNSSKELIKIMYKELGMPEQRNRQSGNLTTDKEALKYLAELTNENDEPKYPFAKYLQDYKIDEAVRKVIDKLPEHMTKDGFIFSTVMQYGTTTGRVSINNPNYQSYNDAVKKNVIPREGFWMFDTDYSSVEYRVLGNMVGNERIMKSFEDPDFDYHQYQAAHMYNVPYSAVTKKLRKAAKGINFGLPYGRGDQSLGIRVFGEESEENTRKAAALRAAYFKGQEDIRDWFEQHRNNGVKRGYTETFFGRRRYYHPEDFTEAKIRRQAGNQVIQGCMGGDTRILTKENGIIKLKDAVGYNYEVWAGNHWTKGDVLYSGKKRKCVVKFKGGLTIICSPQHKFLVRSHRGTERFVECKDLLTLQTTKSAHRVVVNPNYQPSLNRYSSRAFYSYAGTSHNANNVFLDSIKDSFDIGVFLGRLASDGSILMRTDGASCITQFVAEHEYNIIPELLSCMQNLNPKVRVKDRTKENKKEMTELSVYSTSLVKEILALDIKHKVHDNIFADTEVLRGFLSGFFDGDGGISGKAITLQFGIQYNFEPMVLDLQKALLFFGIRSRYRKYKDRYVLAIKTTDNARFLDFVGFLNQDKQNKGRKLICVEDEHIFGRCLLVESVEITNDYIDMYDVCNTERGYFVADGVITHNTAADIYKLAVGRVFKRICKEGWLGKVIFTGFIHDELMGEVSNDINPAVFLKVLREEYEVKVHNDDGSPWCPLYMGFGYGMSWYEAKSTEIPIKLQWEIVDKYGNNGFPDWDGDGRKFCDKVPDMLRDFDVRDIRNQILDVEAQGKEIKPTLNNQVIDCCATDEKVFPKACQEFLELNGQTDDNFILTNLKDFIKYIDDKYHIQGIMTDAEGKLIKEFNVSKTKETQKCLDVYCKLHAVDRNKVNLLDIPDYDQTKQATQDAEAEMLGADYFKEDETTTEEKHLENRKVHLRMLGYDWDIQEKRLYIYLMPYAFNEQLLKFANDKGDGYQIFVYVPDKEEPQAVPRYIPHNSTTEQIVRTICVMYVNSLHSS